MKKNDFCLIDELDSFLRQQNRVGLELLNCPGGEIKDILIHADRNALQEFYEYQLSQESLYRQLLELSEDNEKMELLDFEELKRFVLLFLISGSPEVTETDSQDYSLTIADILNFCVKKEPQFIRFVMQVIHLALWDGAVQNWIRNKADKTTAKCRNRIWRELQNVCFFYHHIRYGNLSLLRKDIEKGSRYSEMINSLSEEYAPKSAFGLLWHSLLAEYQYEPVPRRTELIKWYLKRGN